MIKGRSILLDKIIFKYKPFILIRNPPFVVFDLLFYSLFGRIFDHHFELNDNFRFSGACELKHFEVSSNLTSDNVEEQSHANDCHDNSNFNFDDKSVATICSSDSGISDTCNGSNCQVDTKGSKDNQTKRIDSSNQKLNN